MRPYRAMVIAAAYALMQPSFLKGDELRNVPCDGRFSLEKDSKIVELLVERGAWQQSMAIDTGIVYAVPDFPEFARYSPKGIEQKVGDELMRIRPVNLLYFDNNPKGHSPNDAMYITVQVFKSAEFSWTYLQCDIAGKNHPRKGEMQLAFERTVIAGLEAKLNTDHAPSVSPEIADSVAMR